MSTGHSQNGKDRGVEVSPSLFHTVKERYLELEYLQYAHSEIKPTIFLAVTTTSSVGMYYGYPSCYSSSLLSCS